MEEVEGATHEDDDCLPEEKTSDKRKLQQVVTITQRVRVIRWMVEDSEVEGVNGVILRAIEKFPNEFRSSYKISSSIMQSYKRTL